jgi:hypothetical protein
MPKPNQLVVDMSNLTARRPSALARRHPETLEVIKITKLRKIDREEDEGLAGVGARIKPPKPSDQNSAALRIPRPEQE